MPLTGSEAAVLENEPIHLDQFGSPARELAADRMISRSVVSLVVSASSSWTRAWSRSIVSSGVSVFPRADSRPRQLPQA